MKNDKVISSLNKLNPDDTAKARILDKIEEKQQTGRAIKKPILRLPVVLASAAALLCLAVLSYAILTSIFNFRSSQNTEHPQIDESIPSSPSDSIDSQPPPDHNTNSFSLIAYSMEEQDDGTVELRELGVLLQDDYLTDYIKEAMQWISYEQFFGILITNIGIVGKGNNIKSVEFSVDEGFIGITRASDIHVSNESEIRFKLSIGQGGMVKLIGRNVILEKEDIVDDIVILSWVIADIFDPDDLPSEIIINALATFDDGTTATQTVTLDLFRDYVIIDQLIRWKNWYNETGDYLRSMSPDEWELVPDSVKRVRVYGTYEYTTDLFATGPWTIHAMQDFDEYGNNLLYWRRLHDDERLFVVVIHHGADRSLTGMVYLVPVPGD